GSATHDIYTLSLHDALPICEGVGRQKNRLLIKCRYIDNSRAPKSDRFQSLISTFHLIKNLIVPKSLNRFFIAANRGRFESDAVRDRKSTRLNSSHQIISYAV